mmetsp:Transcript_21044/g.40250  ORF Transcript_21044/g.40250 Transcript_21044/m.40250 type:complete len:84 (-) Transcript_21044:97-348(-)
MATPRHAMGEPATLRATMRARATSLPPAPWKVNGQQLLCTCFSSAMGAMACLQFTEGVLAMLGGSGVGEPNVGGSNFLVGRVL